jgi:hypothetical protein
VEFTLPLDLDPEPKQHQLLYAKSPFHLVDSLHFDHCCGVCNPLRTAFCLFSLNQTMRGFPRSVGGIGRVLECSKFLDLLKRMRKMYWKRLIIPKNEADPELVHALLVLLHALPCAVFFGHDIMWRPTRGYIYFRRWGSVKMGYRECFLGGETKRFDCIQIQNLSYLLKWAAWLLSYDANTRLLLMSEWSLGLCTVPLQN